MSDVDLRVELPSYSYVFTVTVPSTACVLDIKNIISTTCPGNPQPHGQRLVCRGRYLADLEKVDEIWKSSSEPRIVHLAVHPSAWTSLPPQAAANPRTIPAASQPPAASSSAHTNPETSQAGLYATTIPLHLSTPTPTSSQPFPTFNTRRSGSDALNPFAYILLRHHIALLALLTGAIEPTGEETPSSRLVALRAMESLGYSWPSILDDDYPPRTAGAHYEVISLQDRPYLHLHDDTVTPSPFQIHALKVLSHTFAILSLQPPTPTPTRTTQTVDGANVTIPPHVNQVLQQMGLPPLRVNNAGNPIAAPAPIAPGAAGLNPVVREFPVRALVMPLFLLVFRTALILYFVTPARKPIFGVLMLAWVAYEIWTAVVRGLRIFGPNAQNGGNNDPPRQQARQVNLPGADGQVPQNAGAGGIAPPAAAAPAANNNVGQINRPAGAVAGLRGGDAGQAVNVPEDPIAALFDMMSNLNLELEEEAINSVEGQIAARPPTLFHKLSTFAALLITTLHPAVWNRRRMALKRREGRLRTEARARDAPPPAPAPVQETDQAGGEESSTPSSSTAAMIENERAAQARAEQIAKHERRPEWVKEYIERVVADEWVDEAD